VNQLSQVQLQDGHWRTEPHASRHRQSCVEQIDLDTDAHPGGEPQNGQ
jgi:hypothetical protein